MQTIFGDGYPTLDGTCQQGYLNFRDLADVHLKALEYAEHHKSNLNELFQTYFGLSPAQ